MNKDKVYNIQGTGRIEFKDEAVRTIRRKTEMIKN